MRFWICSLTLNFLENHENDSCQLVLLQFFGSTRIAGPLVVHESVAWLRRRPHSCSSNSSWILALPAFAASAVDSPFLLIFQTSCLWIHDRCSDGCSPWAHLFSHWPWYPPLYLDGPFSGRNFSASQQNHGMTDSTSSFVPYRIQSRIQHVALADPCMNSGQHRRHNWAFGYSSRTLRLSPAFGAPHCSSIGDWHAGSHRSRCSYLTSKSHQARSSSNSVNFDATLVFQYVFADCHEQMCPSSAAALIAQARLVRMSCSFACDDILIVSQVLDLASPSQQAQDWSLNSGTSKYSTRAAKVQLHYFKRDVEMAETPVFDLEIATSILCDLVMNFHHSDDFALSSISILTSLSSVPSMSRGWSWSEVPTPWAK